MGALSELIRTHAAQIAELWFVDARRAEAARGLTRSELTRGLIAQLDALGRLADGQGEARALLEPLVEARVEDRLRQGYELADIIHEYALLERCIYQTWASAVSHLRWPSAIEMARVHGALGEVLHAAVGLFTNYLLEEEQLEKRHVTMLYRIAGSNERDSLHNRLTALLAEVRLAIGAEVLVALAWDPVNGRLAYEAQVGLTEEFDEGVHELGDAPLVDDHVVEADRAIELAGIRVHPFLRQAIKGRLGNDAELILAQPLRTGDRLVGALIAALPDRTRLPVRARRFSALAERLAPLWENARLYERAQGDLSSLREERQLREWFVST